MLSKLILNIKSKCCKSKLTKSISIGLILICFVGGAIGAYITYNNHQESKVLAAQKEKEEAQKELENKLAEKVENGELTEVEVDKLKEEGKISEDKATEVKEKVKEKEVAKEEKSNNDTNNIESGNSESSNSGSGSSGSSNSGAGNSGSNDSGTSKPTPTPPAVQVGIDWNLTNSLRSSVIEHTSTYNGIKKNELSELTKQVSLGQVDPNAAINKISNMKWQEKGTNIDEFYSSEMQNITTFNVKCNKFNVPNNMAAADISLNYRFNLGDFGEVYAFRNSDNSITVTSLCVSFMLSSVAN